MLNAHGTVSCNMLSSTVPPHSPLFCISLCHKELLSSNIKTMPKCVHFISTSDKIPHLLAHWNEWSIAIDYRSRFWINFFFRYFRITDIKALLKEWDHSRNQLSTSFFISDRLGLSTTTRQTEAFSTACLCCIFRHYSEYHHYKSSWHLSLPVTCLLCCHPQC